LLLILIDLSIPRLELLVEFKRNDFTRLTPIVIFSGSEYPEAIGIADGDARKTVNAAETATALTAVRSIGSM